MKQNENPYATRLTFINSEEKLQRMRLQEYETWYTGNSDELLNFYTVAMVNQFPADLIYNRNRLRYFWSTAAQEDGFKRVHSGVPRAIIDTLTAVIGLPNINSDKDTESIRRAVKETDLMSLISLRQIPLTLVEGCGCFKINVYSGMKHPSVEYYEAQDVEMRYSCGELVRATFRSYYRDGGVNYMLAENRYVRTDKATGIPSSVIDYHLYMNNDSDIRGKEVPLSELDECKNLKAVEIKGYGKPLAVPSTFFDDPLNPHRGRSVFAGKIDVFDEIDQCLSMLSNSCRVSGAVEYIPEDMLKKTRTTMTDANGNTQDVLTVDKPDVYNRSYVITESVADSSGDVRSGNRIQTTQPELNFDQYKNTADWLIRESITGILSPASIGMPETGGSNSRTERDREKVTIFTRNTIIERETMILKELMPQLLMMYDYMKSGVISTTEHEVNIRFSEFADPSFENEIRTLGPAWSNGQISTELYVNTLWRDRLSDESKEKEIEKLDTQRNNKLVAPALYERNNASEK